MIQDKEMGSEIVEKWTRKSLRIFLEKWIGKLLKNELENHWKIVRKRKRIVNSMRDKEMDWKIVEKWTRKSLENSLKKEEV